MWGDVGGGTGSRGARAQARVTRECHRQSRQVCAGAAAAHPMGTCTRSVEWAAPVSRSDHGRRPARRCTCATAFRSSAWMPRSRQRRSPRAVQLAPSCTPQSELPPRPRCRRSGSGGARFESFGPNCNCFHEICLSILKFRSRGRCSITTEQQLFDESLHVEFIS